MIDIFQNPMMAYFMIQKRREKSLPGFLGIKKIKKTYSLAMNEIMVYNVKQFELKLNKGIESLKQNQIFKPQYD